jgi:NADH:ubiquinone oxidoreductase subunit K
MNVFGVVDYFATAALQVVLLWRARQCRLLARFPFFYSYIVYNLCFTSVAYALYWIRPSLYPSAYWLYFLLSILVEFAVLVEISDHSFQPFPAIRNLGRGLTVLISATFALVYILPAILQPSPTPSSALLDFALRASVTKAVILAVLLLTASHFGLKLGRNVVGLILGFSIFLGISVANFAAAQSFGRALYARILWVMSPIAFTLCLLVWTIALWESAPMPITGSMPPAGDGDSETLAFELARFNNTLSKLLHK